MTGICMSISLTSGRCGPHPRLGLDHEAETPPAATAPHTDLGDRCPQARRWRPIH